MLLVLWPATFFRVAIGVLGTSYVNYWGGNILVNVPTERGA